MQTGELCSRCIKSCNTDDSGIQIECPCCKGTGCDNCEDGKFLVSCPRAYCNDMAEEINIATCAGKGFLPVSGGMLDQTNWFMQLWAAIESEHALIEAERWNRGK